MRAQKQAQRDEERELGGGGKREAKGAALASAYLLILDKARAVSSARASAAMNCPKRRV